MRLRERLARSSRVFLLGLVIACGIEVLVDWHATLTEVAVLRDRVKLRGLNYAAVLAKAGAAPLRARDARELERLASGVFDDREVVFVRFVDASAKPVFEHMTSPWGDDFARARGMPLDRYYAHQIERDTRGILDDPEGLRSRMEHSRHRDVPQAYGDFVRSLAQRFTTPAPPPQQSAVVLYQDRLYDEHADTRERDASITYAVARVDEPSPAAGAVLVAFRMDPTNEAVRGKYLKGLGIVVFFVGLILAQNLASRREKLRLFELESRHAAAKEAVRAAAPEPPQERGGFRFAGALAQADGTVDGALWDAWLDDEGLDLVAMDPQGEGVAAAAIALHVRAAWRRRREIHVTAPLAEEAAALGGAAAQIPLTHPLGLLLLRIRAGRVEGLVGDVGGVRVARGAELVALDESPLDAVPDGVKGPLHVLSGELPAGGAIVIATDGLAEATRRLDVDEVGAFLLRAGLTHSGDPATLVADAAAWARGKNPQLDKSDLMVIAILRRA